ncbi:hypothetical protein FWD07_00355 [Candidatus Saccharibacteria bacterium]|nr:hypothetical protein [Candidatus Saccharibacteria bacterium]
MAVQFDDILERDEKIIQTWKPDKVRFWFWHVVGYVVDMAILIFVMIGFVKWDWEWSIFRIDIAAWMIAVVAIVVLIIEIVLRSLKYKNRLYGYSNKRILVRSGMIGIDYKTLDYKHLTATVVNVGVTDKLLRRNTGALRFGSPSSPIGGSTSSDETNPYNFRHIVAPYDVMREIKEYIDDQEKKAKK